MKIYKSKSRTIAHTFIGLFLVVYFQLLYSGSANSSLQSFIWIAVLIIGVLTTLLELPNFFIPLFYIEDEKVWYRTSFLQKKQLQGIEGSKSSFYKANRLYASQEKKYWVLERDLNYEDWEKIFKVLPKRNAELNES